MSVYIYGNDFSMCGMRGEMDHK